MPAEIRKKMKLVVGQRMLWEMASPTECRIRIVAERQRPGAVAMLGYASTFRAPRKTSDWMKELREGDAK